MAPHALLETLIWWMDDMLSRSVKGHSDVKFMPMGWYKCNEMKGSCRQLEGKKEVCLWVPGVEFGACHSHLDGGHKVSKAYVNCNAFTDEVFLYIAFRYLDMAVGSTIKQKPWGGATHTWWAVVSSTTLWAHKSQGLGATILCLARGLRKNVACILYVDDTDILHLSTGKTETAPEALFAKQCSISRWGNLLTATGGAL